MDPDVLSLSLLIFNWSTKSLFLIQLMLMNFCENVRQIVLRETEREVMDLNDSWCVLQGPFYKHGLTLIPA